MLGVWLLPVAVFEAARSSVCCLDDPSSLCDFIGRKSALGVVDVRLIGAADSFGLERARSKAIAAACNEFEPLEKRRGTRRHSKRKSPEPRGRPESRALTKQMSGQIGIQALCFGDFHLCQQMKVTRPPGRDPANPVGGPGT